MDSNEEKSKALENVIPIGSAKKKAQGNDTFRFEKNETFLGIKEVLGVADDVIDHYNKLETALFDDFKRRERDPYLINDQQESDESIKHKMEESLKRQQEFSKACDNGSLRRILSHHQLNPGHYAGTYILSIAKELKRRHDSGLV